MPEQDSKYYMTISLNVLNHMGLNLYSNTPAVLAEVIANSWDADATEVNVNFDINNKTITITDNGIGMNREDVNRKYLYVGYRKRPLKDSAPGDARLPSKEIRTPVHDRMPMGRKGIGKLSLFSIANKIHVYTRVKGGEAEAFLMNADDIRAMIDEENPTNERQYRPQQISANDMVPSPQGTCVHISDLKTLRLTQASVNGLRRRIARRFSVLGETYNFNIRINDQPVTLADRDYFHKIRFIFQYDNDFAKNCPKLDKNESSPTDIGAFSRPYQFNEHGIACTAGNYRIRGWIGIAWRSNDLDGDDTLEGDNLNKITVVVRGKVAQEDILQQFRLGGMITKYMFGEIEADFLDDDRLPDIATSSRQSISEDDKRYRALANFIQSELKAIWSKTNKLRERSGLRHALLSNPHLSEWYNSLRPAHLKEFAKKIFGDIDRAGIDEKERQGAYANGVLLFEHLKMNHVIHLLQKIDITKVNDFLDYLRDVDALEAEHYRKIVEERLVIIQKLRDIVDKNAKERVLQEYIFDHLFLLDPAWERATIFGDIEKRMEKVFSDKSRADIKYTRYRRVAAAHVIVELKRSSVTVTKTELEGQVRHYIDVFKAELAKGNRGHADLPIEVVCVVGNLPQGWDNEETRKKDEQSLSIYRIRVVTYDELIDNALVAYGKFLEASSASSQLQKLIEEIRTFKVTA